MAGLLERLDLRLSPLGAEQVKMFGGVCFMLNGNMAVGTSKHGLLVRIGGENDPIAAKRKNAVPMIMRNKPMVGHWYVDEPSLADPGEFDYWDRFSSRLQSVASTKGAQETAEMTPASASVR